MAIAFTKVDLPHGWLGNMSDHPVKYDGKWWLTTEALFQALRFDDPAIREELRTIKSPMGCKMRARREKAKMPTAPEESCLRPCRPLGTPFRAAVPFPS